MHSGRRAALQSNLTDLLGPARTPNDPLEQKHKDLARSVQVTYEKAFLALLHALHKKHPCDNLALSGGCAMNSVANGKVYRRTPFKKMYLPAAAGDAGGAIGAAVIVMNRLQSGRRKAESGGMAEEVRSRKSEVGREGRARLVRLRFPAGDQMSKISGSQGESAFGSEVSGRKSMQRRMKKGTSSRLGRRIRVICAGGNNRKSTIEIRN